MFVYLLFWPHIYSLRMSGFRLVETQFFGKKKINSFLGFLIDYGVQKTSQMDNNFFRYLSTCGYVLLVYKTDRLKYHDSAGITHSYHQNIYFLLIYFLGQSQAY